MIKNLQKIAIMAAQIIGAYLLKKKWLMEFALDTSLQNPAFVKGWSLSGWEMKEDGEAREGRRRGKRT